MKKLLVLLFIAFFIQSQAQTANEYLSVCLSNSFIRITINTDTYIEEKAEIPLKESTFNNTMLFAKINEYEKEGWELLDFEFNRDGTSVNTNTCAFMKREPAKKEE